MTLTLNSKTVSHARPAKVTIHAADGWRLCLHKSQSQRVPESKRRRWTVSIGRRMVLRRDKVEIGNSG